MDFLHKHFLQLRCSIRSVHEENRREKREDNIFLKFVIPCSFCSFNNLYEMLNLKPRLCEFCGKIR